mmetsp:Transcript_50677/g.122869  ORF Transcript_50677/g.122869 Transcript_50677/m.122869 type:complete len:231 (-) Transcript_50677:386-1078(-)
MRRQGCEEGVVSRQQHFLLQLGRQRGDKRRVVHVLAAIHVGRRLRRRLLAPLMLQKHIGLDIGRQRSEKLGVNRCRGVGCQARGSLLLLLSRHDLCAKLLWKLSEEARVDAPLNNTRPCPRSTRGRYRCGLCRPRTRSGRCWCNALLTRFRGWRSGLCRRRRGVWCRSRSHRKAQSSLKLIIFVLLHRSLPLTLRRRLGCLLLLLLLRRFPLTGSHLYITASARLISPSR